MVQAQLSDAPADYDYVLTPVMPVVGFPAEQAGLGRSQPLQYGTFTWPFSETGHPAASLCLGMSEEHLPIGVQIVGRHFDDRGPGPGTDTAGTPSFHSAVAPHARSVIAPCRTGE
ncbi:amidase family protein [Streptomyces sp. NPDC027717]|uniref:amidase family protein n=1 Tax=Streptomyces sp. NPDC027717 TaxID=3155765 RepID=UPI0033ED6A7F